MHVAVDTLGKLLARHRRLARDYERLTQSLAADHWVAFIGIPLTRIQLAPSAYTLYIYNPWSDGRANFATATDGTASYKTLLKRADSDPVAAARLELMDHRVPEELYYEAADPNDLDNRIDREFDKARRPRNRLRAWMRAQNDPLLATFVSKDPEAEAAYMQTQRELEEQIQSPRAKRRRQRAERGASRSE